MTLRDLLTSPLATPQRCVDLSPLADALADLAPEQITLTFDLPTAPAPQPAQLRLDRDVWVGPLRCATLRYALPTPTRTGPLRTRHLTIATSQRIEAAIYEYDGTEYGSRASSTGPILPLLEAAWAHPRHARTAALVDTVSVLEIPYTLGDDEFVTHTIPGVLCALVPHVDGLTTGQAAMAAQLAPTFCGTPTELLDILPTLAVGD